MRIAPWKQKKKLEKLNEMLKADCELLKTNLLKALRLKEILSTNLKKKVYLKSNST